MKKQESHYLKRYQKEQDSKTDFNYDARNDFSKYTPQTLHSVSFDFSNMSLKR
jgi:hypothetical protein